MKTPGKWMCVVAVLTHAAIAADQRALAVVTWNIDHGANLQAIGEVLERQAPDLCLLQEVDRNAARSHQQDVGAALGRRLHMNMAYAVEFQELSQEKGTPAFIGQATLSRLPIVRSREIHFTRQSGFWQPHAWIPSNLPLMQRRLGGRVALVTDLKWKDGLLVVYNVHFESRSAGPIQSAQLEEVLSDLQTYPAGTPAILGGDFNSKYFPAHLLHRMEQAGSHSALGERTERTHKIAMALDWLFVRGPFEWTEGAVRQDLKGSDHYPICAKLQSK